VKVKEGRCSIKVADLSEFWNGQKKIILCDPNILACKDHMELLQQLADSKAKVNFNQGLDIRLINDRNLELLKAIKLDGIHFAFDRWQDKNIIEPRLRKFAKETGYTKDKGRVMVYILCNFDTTLKQDLYRIQLCRELRFAPYPMIYDKEHADPIYRKLQRWCNNFIFWKCATFQEYLKG
jgi:UDP-2,3-diacylglucosamine pyrophosphatase LpxH